MVSIRSTEDLSEVLSNILIAGSSCKTVLWCDGLKEEVVSNQRGHRNCDSDDDIIEDEFSKSSKKKKIKSIREEKVQETVDLASSKFTSMQLCIIMGRNDRWGHVFQ